MNKTILTINSNKISVEEAITFLFNNKYLKDYEDFDSISHGSSYKN